ncbi:hypothetical protein [Compostibacter hankyongensis]|uniref:Uncharacterized protein n=1 Tax=Compostibacter hankyongensis TaxID=1007089 RepID=A0ABP8GBI3_9BACT
MDPIADGTGEVGKATIALSLSVTYYDRIIVFRFMTKRSGFLIFLSVCNFSFIHAFGQKAIKEYVQQSIHVIENLDTSSSDYKDLEAIGKAIGTARVVMLGEQDHGDAPTYLAKTRLIKYLHEKKGFNVPGARPGKGKF